MDVSEISAKDDLDKVTLQLKWKHQFQFAGYYAAIEKGFYKNYGLDITLLDAPDDEEPANVVLRGDADFGIATSDIALLRSQGHPVVVLAPIFQHSPLILLVSTESGVTNVHQLAGKQMMIEAHASELIAYLQMEGLSSSQMQIIPHTFNPQMFIDGKIVAMSAYSTDELFLVRKSGTPFLIFTPRAGGIDFYGDTLFTTEQQIRNHPERTKKFLEASLLGWNYALENPEEIIDLIIRKYSTRHSREHLIFEYEMTRKLILPEVVEVGYMNPGRWRHIAETYHKIGMMKPSMPLDGFLYKRSPKPDLRPIYTMFAGVLTVCIIIALIALRFFSLNRTIRKQAQSLQKALDEINVLQGILPICSHCKKIRDDKGSWLQLERYISDRSDVQFSHGICNDCLEKHYDDFDSESEEEPEE